MKNNLISGIKSIIFILLVCVVAKSNAQEVIKAYGGYIHTRCTRCFEQNVEYFHEGEVVVYFETNKHIPDSVIFRGGMVNGSTIISIKYGISTKTNLCNNIVKVTYNIPEQYYIYTGSVYSFAYFDTGTVKFAGKNINDSIDFYIYHEIFVHNIHGVENNSSRFKDIPLIEIEKGYSKVFNLFQGDEENDSIFFEYLDKDYKIQNLKDVKMNKRSGDLFVPDNIDTGIYTLTVGARDYSNYTHPFITNNRLTTTMNEFSIHVINKKLPKFNHFTAAKIDENGIYNVYASPTDKTVNYQADFINPKGLGNYSIDVPATKPLNKPPTVTTTKINDTILHINIDVNLDSGYYQVYRDLPTSLSIIVTTTDSTGNCTQDLTSFYLTNNPTNSIDEVTTKNKISIFPNPATAKLTVTSETAIKEIYIYDLVGKLIKQMNLENTNTKSNEIAIDDLTAGIYIIQVIDVFDAKLSSKFIKE